MVAFPAFTAPPLLTVLGCDAFSAGCFFGSGFIGRLGRDLSKAARTTDFEPGLNNKTKLFLFDYSLVKIERRDYNLYNIFICIPLVFLNSWP